MKNQTRMLSIQCPLIIELLRFYTRSKYYMVLQGPESYFSRGQFQFQMFDIFSVKNGDWKTSIIYTGADKT